MKVLYCYLILTINLFAFDNPQSFLPNHPLAKIKAPVSLFNDSLYYFNMESLKNVSGENWGNVAENTNSVIRMEWENHYESLHSPSMDEISAMAVDSDGNVYVTGRSFHSGGSLDITTIKYNSAGQEMWKVFYDNRSGSWDRPYDIAVDAYGNVYIVGQTRTEYGFYQGVIIKYDSQGEYQWQRRKRYEYGNDYRNAIYAIDIDNNNDIYITGSIITDEGYDILISKVNPLGQELWRNVIDRSEFDYGAKIQVAASGNVYVAAQTESSSWESEIMILKIGVDGGLIWKKVYSSRSSDADEIFDFQLDEKENIYFCGTTSRLGGYFDTILAKYDRDGNMLWNQYYNGTADSNDYANALTIDSSGNVYIACNVMNQNTDSDFALIKYTEFGNFEWIEILNGITNSTDIAHDLYIDLNNNILVLGQLKNSESSDDCILASFTTLGARNWIHTVKKLDNADKSHMFLVPAGDRNSVICGKYKALDHDFDMLVMYLSETGQVKWEQTLNGDSYSDNVPADMSLCPDGGVVVTGSVMGEQLSRDIATIKYNSDGSEAWKYIYNGPDNLQDSPSDLVTDKLGNSYVTGYKTGQTTGKDFITLKFNQDGLLQWENAFGQKENRDNAASCIAIDSTENIIVTGYVSTEGDTSRIYTIKYDPDGNRVWQKRFLYIEPLIIMRPNNLLIDKDNNIYIVAYAGEYSYPNSAFILKYDPDGNVLWYKRIKYPGSYETWLFGMTQDDSLNIYLTGFVHLADGTNTNIITLKLDPEGNEIWSRFYNGPDNHHDQGRRVLYDGKENIYVTGYTVENQNSNTIIIKYNTDGKQLWKAEYNGSLGSTEFANDSAFDSKGNFYVLAYSYNYSADFVVVKYDEMGNDQWAVRYNSAAGFGDMPYKIVFDELDNFYLFGSSYTGNGSVFTTLKYSQIPTAIKEPNTGFADEFKLFQNYPNPYNNITTIGYTIQEKCDVSLKIYNIKGQQVAELVSGEIQPGTYQVNWNSKGQSSGMYFYRLQAGEFKDIRKLVLIK